MSDGVAGASACKHSCDLVIYYADVVLVFALLTSYYTSIACDVDK